MAIGSFDTLVLVAYVLGTLWLGWHFGRRGSVRDYLAGGRDLPWWAVLGSIVATETSTVTFLSVPGLAYTGNWTFLALSFGYVLGRLLVVLLLLPAYFEGEVLSAYDVLRRRFGGATTPLASAVFLVARNLADGLRLLLGALVLAQVTGLELRLCVVLVGLSTLAYTVFGGLRAVVFTDCVQLVVYLGGALLALFWIVGEFPGGGDALREAFDSALAAGKLRVVDLGFSAHSSSFLFAGLIGGAVLSLATHGADHMMVQRLLAARSRRHATAALSLSGPVVTAQFALFLLLGTLLFLWYAAAEPGRTFERGDEVLATWLTEHGGQLPGALGVVLGALFAASMSTLSSSLNASAASYCNDLEPWFRGRRPTEEEMLRRSRRATWVFGAVQIGVGIVAIEVSRSVVAEVLALAGLTSGLLLGLFLLARDPRAGSRDAVIGFACGAAIVVSVHLTGALAWPWYALVSAGSTVLVGMGLARLRPAVDAAQEPPR